MKAKKKARILCLHGKYQTKETFQARLGRLPRKLRGVADLVFVDAPFVLPLREGDDVPTRCWWEEDGDAKTRDKTIVKSIDFLKATWREQGPFHGILGFSMGGIIACSIAVRHVAEQGNKSPFEGLSFLVVAGAPNADIDVLWGSNEKGSFSSCTCHSLHIIGKVDPLVQPSSSHALALRFVKPDIFEHGKGHVFPTDKIGLEKIVPFIEEHTQRVLAARVRSPNSPKAPNVFEEQDGNRNDSFAALKEAPETPASLPLPAPIIPDTHVGAVITQGRRRHCGSNVSGKNELCKGDLEVPRRDSQFLNRDGTTGGRNTQIKSGSKKLGNGKRSLKCYPEKTHYKGKDNDCAEDQTLQIRGPDVIERDKIIRSLDPTEERANFQPSRSAAKTSSGEDTPADLMANFNGPSVTSKVSLYRCRSNEVAQEQQDELEAIAAIYEESIEIREKPPSQKGDQCGHFVMSLERHLHPGVKGNIKLAVQFKENYPFTGGDLLCKIEHTIDSSMFTPTMERSLLALFDREIDNFEDGEQCACTLINMAEVWVQEQNFSHPKHIALNEVEGTLDNATNDDMDKTQEEEGMAPCEQSEAADWYTVEACDEADQLLAREATQDACMFAVSAQGKNNRFSISPIALQSREKIRKLVVGLVGKPSAGKSTFFNCVTRLQTEAKVGAHPFTTIEPNFGTGWWASNDPVDVDHARDGSHAARYGRDGKGRRLLPLLIKDVAGLIPGAYKGHGKGNRFLNDLCDADVLIHVVDSSGTSDSCGNVIGAGDDGASSAETDMKWVRNELHQWIFGNVLNKWHSVVRAAKASERAAEDRLVALFSGYHTPKSAVVIAAARAKLDLKKPHLWNRQQLHLMVAHFLTVRFPMCLALNKIDKLLNSNGQSVQNFETKIEEAISMATKNGYVAVPCSAKLETQLIRLASIGEIGYEIGAASTEEICSPPCAVDNAVQVHKITKEKVKILNAARNIMEVCGSTGVLEAVSRAVALRDPILVYPVSDVHKGSPLGAPSTTDSRYIDCLCALPGSTIEDLYESLKRGAVDGVRVEGDFILAEVSSLNWEHQSALQSKQLGKDAKLSAANAVVKVMTNRKISWQKRLT